MALTIAEKSPEFVQVDALAPGPVFVQSENSDALFTEVARVVFEHVDSVVVLSSGVSAARRMLPVLANPTVPVRNVSSEFSCVPLSSSHCFIDFGRSD